VFEVPLESALHFAGVSDQQIQLYRAEMQVQKNSEMQRLVSEFEIAGKSLSYIVESGSTLAVILEKAEALRPDLIVVGKHGLSEKERVLPGGVTKHVLQGTDCDVLIVDGVS
jgi:nucleotide-binding universal stress UspA family protein